MGALNERKSVVQQQLTRDEEKSIFELNSIKIGIYGSGVNESLMDHDPTEWNMRRLGTLFDKYNNKVDERKKLHFPGVTDSYIRYVEYCFLMAFRGL
jgi:hypothetical protein